MKNRLSDRLRIGGTAYRVLKFGSHLEREERLHYIDAVLLSGRVRPKPGETLLDGKRQLEITAVEPSLRRRGAWWVALKAG